MTIQIGKIMINSCHLLPHFHAADYRLGMPWVLDEGKHMDLRDFHGFSIQNDWFFSDCWTRHQYRLRWVRVQKKRAKNSVSRRFFSPWLLDFGAKKGGSLHGFLGLKKNDIWKIAKSCRFQS
jgi:hypothetical protein